MRRWSLWLILLSALVPGVLIVSCTPNIGNHCQLSTDCSQLGDRLCDTTQPEGYCTVFNCEPDSCPNSICVAFDPTLDPACGNAQSGRYPRFERSFCLAPCSQDSDCRGSYECVNLDPWLYPNMPNPSISSRAAQVVDLGAGDGGLGWSVCMVYAAPDAGMAPQPFDDGGAPQVCVACPESMPSADAGTLACTTSGLQCDFGATVCTCGKGGTWSCSIPDPGCDGGLPWCPYVSDGG